VKLISKFISKNLFFFYSKLNGQKLGFNTPLRLMPETRDLEMELPDHEAFFNFVNCFLAVSGAELC